MNDEPKRTNIAVIQLQLANLLLAHPELADDEELRRDMIEAETDVHELLRRFQMRRVELLGDVEKNAKHVAYYSEIKARKEQRAETMEALIVKVMEKANLRKVRLPEGTLTVQDGKDSVVINDPQSVPNDLCRVTYTPNKTLIKEKIDAGASYNFAAVVRGEPYLVVRK